MIRLLFLSLAFWPLCLLSGSQRAWDQLDPVSAAPIRISATRLNERITMVKPPLKYLGAWSLKSSDSVFGGISALARTAARFVAISDTGVVFRFDLTPSGVIIDARKAPLPAGCTTDDRKASRDAESLSFLDAGLGGDSLIGFEWFNQICRADVELNKARRVTAPPALRHFPRTGGAEAMVALQDGRTLVFAERPAGNGDNSPIVIFDRDPTDPGARWSEASYQPPPGYRATDVAQLPDGRLIIVNRRFDFPYDFSSQLTLIDPTIITPGACVAGVVMAKLTHPGIADNFEAVAVSQNRERTFIWLMSDDNYSSLQRTLLVLFELGGEPSVAP